MTLLWVCPFFLHPTEKGSQIRTLGLLRCLCRRHEVHFAALEDPDRPEGRARSREYCSRSYSVPWKAPGRGSIRFLPQLAGSVASKIPLGVSRYYSRELKEIILDLTQKIRFDSIVCDFLAAAPNIPQLSDAVLYQHNVETVILERQTEHAPTPVHRAFFASQARKMRAYEREVCRSVRHVVAVSAVDARRMESMFDLPSVSETETGVDVEYFTPPAPPPARKWDLVFTGSMDWLPNVDGISYFAEQILPRIRREKPDCTVAVVGRNPDPKMLKLAQADPLITLTGTVPDVRPYLWAGAVSIVPLRIGGGTRLKIYEYMAAQVPIVSTTIGAEGLVVEPGSNILLADTPEDFADSCLRLLSDGEERARLGRAAYEMVNARFSWEMVSRGFEEVLVQYGK